MNDGQGPMDEFGGNGEIRGEGHGPVFHYDRSKRLARAPESVRRAYEEGYTPNKGFIKGLTANPGLRSMLFVIILLSVIIMGVSILGDTDGHAVIDGTELRLKAFPFEEAVYVSLTLKGRNDFTGEPVPVIAVLQGINAEGAVVAEKELVAVYTGRELPVRGILQDFDVKRVSGKIKYGKNEGRISVTVDRK